MTDPTTTPCPHCGSTGGYCAEHDRPTEADDLPARLETLVGEAPNASIGAAAPLLLAAARRIRELDAEVARLTALGDALAEAALFLINTPPYRPSKAGERLRSAIDAWENR